MGGGVAAGWGGSEAVLRGGAACGAPRARAGANRKWRQLGAPAGRPRGRRAGNASQVRMRARGRAGPRPRAPHSGAICLAICLAPKHGGGLPLGRPAPTGGSGLPPCSPWSRGGARSPWLGRAEHGSLLGGGWASLWLSKERVLSTCCRGLGMSPQGERGLWAAAAARGARARPPGCCRPRREELCSRAPPGRARLPRAVPGSPGPRPAPPGRARLPPA
jgi:hypothetical protein